MASSGRTFWRPSTAEQLGQIVQDQQPNYIVRTLTSNEVDCVALNEIAATHGRGFFFHLPAKRTLDSNPDEARLPVQRRVIRPRYIDRPVPAMILANGMSSPEYPDIVMMDYEWEASTQDAFLASPARSRYLHSSAMMNPPDLETPLHPIQYIAAANSQIFKSARESFVIFATTSQYYLLTTQALERIVGRHPTNANRLNIPQFLWKRDMLANGADLAQEQRRQQEVALAEYAVDSLEDVYYAIRARCAGAGRDMHSDFTTASLQQIIPRPDAIRAAAVGRALGAGTSADAPSRRGEYRTRSRKRKADTGADEGDDNAGDEEVGEGDERNSEGEVQHL